MRHLGIRKARLLQGLLQGKRASFLVQDGKCDIADDVEDLMYRTTEYMIPMLENNFGYYFPYVEEFYNKIKELEEKNNG